MKRNGSKWGSNLAAVLWEDTSWELSGAKSGLCGVRGFVCFRASSFAAGRLLNMPGLRRKSESWAMLGVSVQGGGQKQWKIVAHIIEITRTCYARGCTAQPAHGRRARVGRIRLDMFRYHFSSPCHPCLGML